MPKEAPGATALVVENPHTDPVTVAWSKVDVRRDRLAECDPEIERLKGKVAKFARFTKEAQEAVDTAVAAKATHQAALDEAKAELAAVEEANPELAESTRARRKTADHQRINELQAELAKLKDN